MAYPRYQYDAEVVKVVDGDTLHLNVILIDVDLGFDTRLTQTQRVTVRLAGIDALPQSTAAGKGATTWLNREIFGNRDGVKMEDAVPNSGRVVIRTTKDKKEKYGRYLAEVWVVGDDLDQNLSLNELMVELGLAVRYDGGKKTQ